MSREDSGRGNTEKRSWKGKSLIAYERSFSSIYSRRSFYIFMLRSVFLLFLLLSATAFAQMQTGSIAGTVTDPAGAAVAAVKVELRGPATGYSREKLTDDHGSYAFYNVPFGEYELRVEVAGFVPFLQMAAVRSDIPVVISAQLALASTKQSMTVSETPDLLPENTGTENTLDASVIQRTPVAGSQRLQGLIATTPGWNTEDNGLMHVRGVDDGVLYVIDGIPTKDRRDALFASPFDTESIASMQIITGNVPAEFGGRSGAVVVIQPKSGIDTPWHGELATGFGSFSEGQISSTVNGGGKKAGFSAEDFLSQTDRFLDPVDPHDYNNHGAAGGLTVRADWHLDSHNTLLFSGHAGGSDFHVTNHPTQQLAGQNQRQQNRDDSQSVTWLHNWSENSASSFAFYRDSYNAKLMASAFDTPITAAGERDHSRYGALGSYSYLFRGHLLKIGVEGSKVNPKESFQFAVTDAAAAADAGVSDAALAFTTDNPFLFRQRHDGNDEAAYLQDSFSPWHALSVDAGVRFDDSHLIVSGRQWSPRIGLVYSIGRTNTALRASFNRLFMPPQVENLLLASSAEARALSPFAGSNTQGGASIFPEHVTAYEAGFAQQIANLMRLDVAYWWRKFRNIDDPNVFFSSTLIFPNTVAAASAHGLDARLDFPLKGGFSGYLSYSNSRTVETGPLNGGLFLTDDFIEIGPGTRFTPDHDQRNSGAFGVTYLRQRRDIWATFTGRYESGVPLNVNASDIPQLQALPGASLVNFDTLRVRPRALFSLAAGMDLYTRERVNISAQLDLQNLTNKDFVYNFGDPFAGTHFGYPRIYAGRLKFAFR